MGLVKLASKEAAYELGLSDAALRAQRHRGTGMPFIIEQGRIYYTEMRVELEKLKRNAPRVLERKS